MKGTPVEVRREPRQEGSRPSQEVLLSQNLELKAAKCGGRAKTVCWDCQLTFEMDLAKQTNLILWDGLVGWVYCQRVTPDLINQVLIFV